MASYRKEILIQLLTAPTESLTEEHKGWLDLTLNPHKANLAKAAIALANEGGGIIVLGTREDTTQGGKLGSYPCPPAIPRYSLDAINGVIARYADPAFHCELVFAEHPDTKVEHAFVIVPGGMTVPVMSCRGSDGEIQAQRCYVRKPGPKSEEPYTAEEWRKLLDRCLQAGRESMLDAIRAIVQGRTDTSPVAPTVKTRLQNFVAASQARWETLIASLPSDDPARMPKGHYEVAFTVLGIEQPSALAELRRQMNMASSISLTGWPPFVYLHRFPFEPQPVDGAIETWLGNPNDDHRYRDPVTCDFWRAHPSGEFFLLRGYDEDSISKLEPGDAFDVVLPIWRIGEIMLFAARLAKLLTDDPEILFICRYTGLRNRRLVRVGGFTGLLGRHISLDDTVSLEIQTTAHQIEDNLVEILHPLLLPLYERFSFFELKPAFVAEEVERLKSGRY